MSASVAGIVYNDLNVASTFKSGDPMLAGVRVYADIGNHNAYKAGDPTAITNGQGAYKISGLAPGSYVLREVVPAQFRQTEPSNGGGQKVTIASALTHLSGVNFGDTQKVRVGGFVFDDANGDGAQNHGEGILAGVTVYLDSNGNKKLDASELHATTNSAGYWVIGDLPPGHTYTARVALPAGFVQTDPTGNGGHAVSLQNGQTADNLLFGIRPATVVFNSQLRVANAAGGSVYMAKSSNNVGFYDTTASITDPSLGDGGTANLSSNITSNTIMAEGSLSTVGSHDEGSVFDAVDVTFTLTAATKYSTGYDVFGNDFSLELNKLNNGGGAVIDNVPSNDPSITSYAFSKSGTLAAGKYEFIFQVSQNNSNIFGTKSFLMNFILE